MVYHLKNNLSGTIFIRYAAFTESGSSLTTTYTHIWNASKSTAGFLPADKSTAGFLPADKSTASWQLDKTEKYVHDNWNVIAVTDENDTLQKSYLWGEDLSGSLQGAGGGGLLAVTDTTNTYLPAYDCRQCHGVCGCFRKHLNHRIH